LADPVDLVARAFAILDQDKMRRPARFLEAANIASQSATPSLSLGPASDDLQLQRRLLSNGAECFLPIRYFDVQCLVATFLAAPDRASELLEGAGLQPILQEDGRAVVDLYCIEYRKTDIGPYNEVGLTVRAKAPGDPIAANYVLNLPVTTAMADRVGREIWGYNKFVAAIDVKSEGKTFSTVLRDSDHEIIGALEGQRSVSAPAPAADILTFSLDRGRLIKTTIRVLTPSLAGSGDSFAFKIGTSRHPMTSNLRTLSLDGAHPVLVHYTDPFQALLFPGRALSNQV
jgi:Acetoacetate decarboxylase (ADC)